MRLAVFALLAFIFSHSYGQNDVSAENFGASLMASSHFCQIDGDANGGYNKLGYSIGYLVNIQFKNSWFYETGVAFSLRGSRSIYDNNNPSSNQFDYSYKMIDVPILFKKQIQQFLPYAGIITTYLIHAKDRFNQAPNLNADMQKFNIMGTLGTEYALSKRWSLNAAVQLSLNTITQNNIFNTGSQVPTSLYFRRGGVYHNVLAFGFKWNLSE